MLGVPLVLGRLQALHEDTGRDMGGAERGSQTRSPSSPPPRLYTKNAKGGAGGRSPARRVCLWGWSSCASSAVGVVGVVGDGTDTGEAETGRGMEGDTEEGKVKNKVVGGDHKGSRSYLLSLQVYLLDHL